MKTKKYFKIFILMIVMLIVGLGTNRAFALSDDDKKIVQTSLENLNSGENSLEKSRETIQSVMKAEDKAAVAEILVGNAGCNFKITALFWQLAQDLGVSNEFQAVLEQSLAQKADIVGETTRLAIIKRVSNNTTPDATDPLISDLVQAISEDNTDKFSELLRRGIDFSSPIPLAVIPDLPWLDQRQTITPLDLAAMLGSVKCFNYLTASAGQPITFDTLIAACVGEVENSEIIHKCIDQFQSPLTPRVLCQCVQIAIAFNYDSDFAVARWLSEKLAVNGASWQQIAALWARNDQAWEFFINHYRKFYLPEDKKDFLVETIKTLKAQKLDLQNDPQVIAKMIEHERDLKAILPVGEDTSAFYQALLETTRLGAVAVDEETHSSRGMLFPDNNFAVIPHGTTSIGRIAFREKENLRFVSFPDGLENIGEFAFSYCTSLTKVNLPNGLTNIGDSAFFSCNNLATVKLPDGFKNIGEYAFFSCNNLATINFPEGLTRIGDYAFSECISLTAVNLPENLARIGFSSFYNCSNLTTVNFQKGLTRIEEYAFANCDSLTTVNFSEGFDKSVLNDEIFLGCSKLKFPQ